MLNEVLEKIAASKSYEYRIGAEHWQNLIDGEDDSDKPFAEKKKYLMFFQETEADTYGNGQFGNVGVSQSTVEGVFFLAVRSRLTDPDFKYKYDNHIKPLVDLAKQFRDELLPCEVKPYRFSRYAIESWREDYLDTNLDCVEVRLTLVNGN